ncbi:MULTISPECIES: hypothetical protein [unclassified Corallococcus]|uniref:hypothetical protein n=1 Tax=unclassified Corallococcus TaxID=2685029 RepID=UPI001A900314|nr:MULTISPECIES: hypothetical protein [unclassified Corallococcus]MBN9685385.1 hypothetical protein [Corallococcus sp. NCSPR001]WAS83164.1 hypothetical protein O0N60_28065 [Corallococcus sp. NCRR]
MISLMHNRETQLRHHRLLPIYETCIAVHQGLYPAIGKLALELSTAHPSITAKEAARIAEVMNAVAHLSALTDALGSDILHELHSGAEARGRGPFSTHGVRAL